MNSNSFEEATSYVLENLSTPTNSNSFTALNGISADYPLDIYKDPIDSTNYIIPSIIADQSYLLNEPELEIIFDPFVFNVTECTDVTIAYTVFVNNSATLPSFIDYESSQRAIWILS